MRLPAVFFFSELGTSYRVFLEVSIKMVSNFPVDVVSGQIRHLLNLSKLYYKISEFQLLFRRRVKIDVVR